MGARARFRQAAEIGEGIGDLKLWAASSIMIAMLDYLKGNSRASLNLCEKVSSAGRAAGDSQVFAWGLHGEAFNMIRFGELLRSEELLLEAAALLKNIPGYYVLQLALSDLAMCRALQGKLDKARDVINEADMLIKEHSLRGWVNSFIRNTHAEINILKAEKLQAIERLRELRRVRKSCKVALRANSRFKLGEARSYRLMGTFCWLEGRESLANIWWEKGLRIAVAQGAKYEGGLIYYERGKRMKDSDFVKRAQFIFEQLDARLDLERIQWEKTWIEA